MTGLLIFLFVIILLWWLWPMISRLIRAWVMRKLQRRAEDYIRQAAGMPPHDADGEPRRNRRRATTGNTGEARRRNTYHTSAGPIIPKEYAVDVEYTEIKDYSSETVIRHNEDESSDWHESQVSDAEWVEIKSNDK